MPRPIIFDFDGTIVDSEPLANRGLAEVLTELGFPTTYDEALSTYVGLRMVDCVDKIAKIHGRKPPDDFADICRARVSALIDRHLEPVSGVVPFIRARPRERIAIASSSRITTIERGLDRIGLKGAFSGRIYSAADLERGKPHPDIYLLAAQGLAANPGECIAIEDSVLGVQSAVAASMIVIGLTAGTHCGPDQAARLTAAGAHTVARNYVEVAAFIEARAE